MGVMPAYGIPQHLPLRIDCGDDALFSYGTAHAVKPGQGPVAASTRSPIHPVARHSADELHTQRDTRTP